ncbi:MAG: hypothetical protein LBT27_07490, partial [Prevotellaceae bacterium]|nr:hypothetical protein [Prevotellaceae bacterium]
AVDFVVSAGYHFPFIFTVLIAAIIFKKSVTEYFLLSSCLHSICNHAKQFPCNFNASFSCFVQRLLVA